MAIMQNPLMRQIQNITNAPDGTIANLVDNAGQLGVGPQLTRIDAATPLVFPPIVPIITHVPTMFRSFPHAVSILKALVERHTKTITGIDFGYEIEEGTGYALADGQEAKVPTKTKRTAVSPSMTFAEVNGNLVWNFFKFWITMMCDADTHHSRLAAVMTENDQMDPFVYSFFAMDIMFIQFDITMKPENIIDATFGTTIWPKTTGNIGMQKEIGVSNIQERSIDFNGIIQHNENTYNAGVAIAEMLNLHKANFDFALPIASSIEEAAQQQGVQQEIEAIMQEFKSGV